ncbi:ERF family protein [Streptomyces sp. LHD-70]|uniref:ERF family protein n=1 Tax=Streptomyces sp. LHD-70 TaxID=3072140 RepID=UPI00280FA4A2|nr:ERF family protein [Streptomyces sp. LHD-70]MDQ8704888.1 ERF family protein [Streptomyces sp. LHD-70]
MTAEPSITKPKPPPAAPQKAVTVHQAINAVMRDMDPVGKNGFNDFSRYKFRSVEDVINAANGAFVRHGLFIAPEVVNERYELRGGKNNTAILTIKYRIFGPSGDHVEAVMVGEGSDVSDKAANKAMTAGFKYLLNQVFMIPTESTDDSDRDTPVGAPDPLSGFLARMRDPYVWNDPKALSLIAQDAELAQVSGHRVPMKAGAEPVTLAQLISNRRAQLNAQHQEQQAA